MKQFWFYCYRKIYSDLREYVELCGPNRVLRLMKQAGIKAQAGYRKPRSSKGKPNIVTPNRLKRQFSPATPMGHGYHAYTNS